MIKYIVALMIFVVTSTAMAAKISDERAAIGGISIGSKMDYIKSIYGEPSRSGNDSWYYGDTFAIDFTGDKVSAIASSGNNGMTTPDGVTVGMKVREVKRHYGRPSKTLKFDNRTIYIYNVDNDSQMMFFITDKLIREIRCTK